ncbi:hypothetical protein [Oleiharenicola lentus]|uniref:hypothetical protein n=1 Tax=Oleiharenicola lentus TaxID=2508720 RepID=UPI003F67C108
MKTPLTRRLFLLSSAQLIAAAPMVAAISPLFAPQGDPTGGTAPSPAPTPSQRPKLPALAPELVQNVVGQSHRSLDKVRELVEGHPLLVNASWDWGNGDFETPLQAAAHTGQREIAEYLLSKNARPDVFAAAMLGQLEFVKAAFVGNPNAQEIPGPHGFTLLHCAKQGGVKAKPVYDWLVGRNAGSVFQRPLPPN